MSAALRRLGFEVRTELDADRVELTEALRGFTRQNFEEEEMRRFLFLGVLLAAGLLLLHGWAEASGSIGAGAGKVSPRAAYSQGKALTFDTLVCNGCPVQRLDRNRAETLRADLEAAHSASDATAEVTALCGGAAVQGDECTLKLELVYYFLTRRYKLS